MDDSASMGAMTFIEHEMQHLATQELLPCEWQRAASRARQPERYDIDHGAEDLWLLDSQLATMHAGACSALVLFNAWTSWTSTTTPELACLALWAAVGVVHLAAYALPHNDRLQLARAWLTLCAPLVAMAIFTLAFAHWSPALKASWVIVRTDGVIFSEIYAYLYIGKGVIIASQPLPLHTRLAAMAAGIVVGSVVWPLQLYAAAAAAGRARDAWSIAVRTGPAIAVGFSLWTCFTCIAQAAGRQRGAQLRRVYSAFEDRRRQELQENALKQLRQHTPAADDDGTDDDLSRTSTVEGRTVGHVALRAAVEMAMIPHDQGHDE
eukprot:CAMPEP_0119360942 /NCGR_PEP_ID=MMETSP1334-20130426/8394_1 /TAXON_ID=127549 /ORGANISM="Calcidiscus leptoporus, Strain RCC1130" /LENGTH=321 /DNA_ID=CAMNT_0007375853 /DNA_START=52 /DNA_END=1017 /DNA_ORIENTATION=+